MDITYKAWERESAQVFPTPLSTGMTFTRGDCKLTLEQPQLLAFLQHAVHPPGSEHTVLRRKRMTAAVFLRPSRFVFSLRKPSTCEHARLRALEIKSPESLWRGHLEIHTVRNRHEGRQDGDGET